MLSWASLRLLADARHPEERMIMSFWKHWFTLALHKDTLATSLDMLLIEKCQSAKQCGHASVHIVI